ncbi:MAG TPA: mobilization protein [Planctomycetota bacterium]|nr:mobilization protein [Planctomycetota bacterium]
MSSIHFIGGEKGGVGKSVVARLLAQYFVDRSTPFLIVDADRSHGAMQRFYADFTQPGDLDNFETTDHVLQLALDTDRRVLVDLPAQSDRLLHKWMDSNGIVELAAEHKIPLTFWHVMDGGQDSLNLLQVLLDRYGSSVNYVLVRNRGVGRDFSAFEKCKAKELADQLHARIITIEELHGPTMAKIDKLSASFWAAANNSEAGLGVIERHRVKVWLRKAYSELEKAAP